MRFVIYYQKIILKNLVTLLKNFQDQQEQFLFFKHMSYDYRTHACDKKLRGKFPFCKFETFSSLLTSCQPHCFVLPAGNKLIATFRRAVLRYF